MESHSENTRSVTCYQILRKDDSYINHLESWVPTHSSINTDQSEVREKVSQQPALHCSIISANKDVTLKSDAPQQFPVATPLKLMVVEGLTAIRLLCMW